MDKYLRRSAAKRRGCPGSGSSRGLARVRYDCVATAATSDDQGPSTIKIAGPIVRPLKVGPIHPDYFDWPDQRELTVRFKFDWPDLSTLNRTAPELFKRLFNPTKPVFIETDGACSRNPGPGGWGFIICQEDRKIETYGAMVGTSNNAKELRAIDEILTFIPSERAYAIF
jgi:hypothetical protein